MRRHHNFTKVSTTGLLHPKSLYRHQTQRKRLYYLDANFAFNVMSTLEDLDDLEREGKDNRNDGDDGDKDGKKPTTDGDADMKDAAKSKKEEDVLDAEILNSGTRDIQARRRLLENDTRIMRSEFQRLSHEKAAMHEKIKDNLEKIENNR